MNKHHLTLGLLAFCLVLAPFTTQAVSETASSCKKFENNLRYGTAGNTIIKADVVRLQDFLYGQQLFNVQSTGYFGPLTLSAVKKFQAKYNIPTTGFVGPLTRAKINALGACGGGQDLFPTIYNITGPTTLKVNEQGTWTVTASDRMAGTLSYYVWWGDEPISVNATPAGVASPLLFTQTSTFSHVYSSAGTYRITFTVRNDQTKSVSQKTATVTVIDPSQPKVTVTAPNGGEKWNSNSTQYITWNLTNNVDPNAKVDLYLIPQEPPSYQCPPPEISGGNICPMMPVRMPYILDKNIAWNFSYNWIVGTDIVNQTIPRGVYYVKVCMAGSEINCDMSDGLFTIVDSAYESNRPPVITGISGPTSLTGNQPGTWTVSAYDPEGGALTYNGSWSGSVLASNTGGTWPAGSTNTFSTSFPFRGGTTYTLRFTVTDSVGKSAETTITVVQN